MIPTNPNMVIMDTGVVSPRSGVALGLPAWDALSTYFEARANKVSGCQTMPVVPSLAAQAIAELCYKTLLADGYKAKLAVEQGSAPRRWRTS